MGRKKDKINKRDFFNEVVFLKTFGHQATTILDDKYFYSFEEIYKMVDMPDDLEKYLDKTMSSGETDENEKYYLLLQDMIKVYLIYVEIYRSTYDDDENAFLRSK